jgi:hypothetical protein
MAVDRQHRLIIDPSVVFTDGRVDWLQRNVGQPFRGDLVVSSALATLLSDGKAVQLLGRAGISVGAAEVEQARGALEGINRFSWRDVKDLGPAPDAARIRDALLETRGRDAFADVWADEWIFSTTQSWGIRAGVARSVNAFRAAGGRVHEIADAQVTQFQDLVKQLLPASVFAAIKGAAKFPRDKNAHYVWVGGEVALGLVPGLAIPVAVVAGLRLGGAIITGDP